MTANRIEKRFRGLQNYTTLKLAFLDLNSKDCFRGLQNYTTLKLVNVKIITKNGFRGLQNYTTLKQCIQYILL